MKNITNDIKNTIEDLKTKGTYKTAPLLDSPMDATVTLENGTEVVNLCSNNYLGLANHPDVIQGAQDALAKYGNGTASVRFICGSLTIHQQLEKQIADFLDFEASTTYVSCWNANESLIPTLLNPGDTVISDQLNHASIIDACRLTNKKVNPPSLQTQ